MTHSEKVDHLVSVTHAVTRLNVARELLGSEPSHAKAQVSRALDDLHPVARALAGEVKNPRGGKK